MFISPNDPVVLYFSKFVAGLIRDRVRPDISENLQYGMGLFEGLRLTGIAYTPDPSTLYISTHADPEAVDYIQYPHQTIAYKSGDGDDLGLLYAAVLESVGVHAAYIPLPEDFLVAVDLNMSEEIAERVFQRGPLLPAGQQIGAYRTCPSEIRAQCICRSRRIVPADKENRPQPCRAVFILVLSDGRLGFPRLFCCRQKRKRLLE